MHDCEMRRRASSATSPFRVSACLAEWASCRKGTTKLSNEHDTFPALFAHVCSAHFSGRCQLHSSVHELPTLVLHAKGTVNTSQLD
jgi:hypothetical protein